MVGVIQPAYQILFHGAYESGKRERSDPFSKQTVPWLEEPEDGQSCAEDIAVAVKDDLKSDDARLGKTTSSLRGDVLMTLARRRIGRCKRT